MNNIFQKQSEKEFRSLLAAFRQVYIDGKKYNSWIFGFTFLTSIIVPILSMLNIGDHVSVFTGIVGIFVTIFLKKIPAKKAVIAARIQEQFDTELYTTKSYDFKWNKSLAKSKVDINTISDAELRYDKTQLPAYWYENYDMEHSHAVLHCQKENLWWDKQQKATYAQFLIGVSVLVLLFGLTLAYFFNIDSNLVYLKKIFLPQAALIVYMLLIVIKNFQIKNEFEGKIAHANKLYEKYKSSTQVIPVEDLREIQDIIYENRSKGELVPEWYHNRVKKRLQKVLNTSVKKINQ